MIRLAVLFFLSTQLSYGQKKPEQLIDLEKKWNESGVCFGHGDSLVVMNVSSDLRLSCALFTDTLIDYQEPDLVFYMSLYSLDVDLECSAWQYGENISTSSILFRAITDEDGFFSYILIDNKVFVEVDCPK